MDEQDDVENNGSIGNVNRRNEKLPVDHGWAWFVLLGATVNVLVLMVFLRSTSLLFIFFLDMYQASATVTTLVFALSSTTFSTSNIVASTVLIRRFRVRSLCLTGAIINFFSIIGIAYAPNIIVVNVLFAVLGAAHGLIVVPQLTLVGHYFKRHLSLATATTTMGISLATVGGTPLTQMLLDMYGVRGTVLLMAAITLHCVPASMLLRPTSFYKPEPTALNGDEHTEAQRYGESKQCYNGKECGENVPIEDQISLLSKTVKSMPPHNNDSYFQRNEKRDGEKHTKLKKTLPRRERSVSESWHVPMRTLNTRSHVSSTQDICESGDSIDRNQNDRAKLASVSNIFSASLRYLSNASSLYSSSYFQSRPSHLLETNSQLSLDHKNCKPGRLKSPNDALSPGSFSENGRANKSCFRKLRESASESVYTDPVSVLLLLASGLGVHAQAGINYMPAMGIENGLTEKQVSLLLTALGVADVISKFAVGVLADTGIIRRIHIACLSQLTIGAVFQTVAMFQGFPLMIFLQALVGMSIGVFHVLLPVITVDLLGVQHMGHIVAGYMLINGIVNALDHVVVGSLNDLTGSFHGSYHYMGSLALMSVAILLSVPLVKRYFKSKTPDAENEQTVRSFQK